MLTRLKKTLFLLPAICSCILISGCSEEMKAEKIYNSNGTNKEKIDQLVALYFDSHTSNSSYNKVVGDRAWGAIEDGNYDKAVSILGGAKSASGGEYALYYIGLLQEPLPTPNSVNVIVTNRNDKFYWDFEIDYPQLNIAPSINGITINEVYFEITISIENGRYYSYDTGECTQHSMHWKKDFELDKDYTGSNFDMTFSIKAKSASKLDYYKPSDYYKYKISFDLNNLYAGIFECEYIS